MTEINALRKIIMKIKAGEPTIDQENCLEQTMIAFAKRKPYLDTELQFWHSIAFELVQNYL